MAEDFRPRRIVFVLGAGASVKFGFPTGPGLANQISEQLVWEQDSEGRIKRPDETLFHVFERAYQGSKEELVATGAAIAEAISLFPSVDEFLFSRRSQENLVWIGKLAIAATIMQRERSCFLSNFSRPETSGTALSELKTTWLSSFFRNLAGNVSSDDPTPLFKDIGFVNFNYDRCLEESLFHLVRIGYGVDEPVAAATIKELEVVHPYGSLGKLPWQHDGNLPFGSEIGDLAKVAGQITTYMEDTEAREDVALARKLMRTAKTIVFLGFGFHPQNMRLLDPDIPRDGRDVSIWSTVYRESGSNQQVIRDLLDRHLLRPGSGAQLDGNDCETFVEATGRKLLA